MSASVQPSSLTVDKLRRELADYGVVPPKGVKKDALVELYKQHVSPPKYTPATAAPAPAKDLPDFDFSSDDDESMMAKSSSKVSN